jgi:hypothetical protein
MAGQDRKWWHMGKLAPPKTAVKEAVKRVILRRHACDRCGVDQDGNDISTAKFEIRTAKGPLFFCRHHYMEHCHAILAGGIEVVDQESLTAP